MGGFWTPKSVFKGTNADGSKFTVKEWEWGSLGSGMPGLGGVVGILVAIMFTSLIAPLMLILSVLSYKGKYQVTSIIGIVIGAYFLYDANHFWMASQLTSILFGSKFVAWCVAMTTASIVCHIVLLLTTLITKGEIFSYSNTIRNDKNGGILMFILVCVFLVTYHLTKSVTKNHGTYNEYEKQDIAKKKTEDSVLNLSSEQMEDYYNDKYEKQCLERGDSPEEAHRISHE